MSLRPRRNAATRFGASSDDRGARSPMTGTVNACAPAAKGQAIKTAIPLAKSRRRIATPKAQDCADRGLQCTITARICGRGNGVSWVKLHGSNLDPLMSPMGHSRLGRARRRSSHVRYAPKAEVKSEWYDLPRCALCAFNESTPIFRISVPARRAGGSDARRCRA
jgi:hypothetical protein